VGPGRPVRRTEVEIGASPLAVDIHQIVKSRLAGRGLEVARL
jgi:hypothetical protein